MIDQRKHIRRNPPPPPWVLRTVFGACWGAAFACVAVIIAPNSLPVVILAATAGAMAGAMVTKWDEKRNPACYGR